MNKQLFIEISFIACMKYRLVHEDLGFDSGEGYEFKKEGKTYVYYRV